MSLTLLFYYGNVEQKISNEKECKEVGIGKSLKSKSLVTLTLVMTLAAPAAPSLAVPLSEVETNFAKNVIVMIPDGMSQDGLTLARWVYNDGKPLNVDELASGLVKTHNADTAIADSAPAGTAMATGYKTNDKLVGVKPAKATLEGAREVTPEDALAPAASVLEAAKLSGKSVGIVSTSEIQHATPADFSSHVIHRNMYTAIGEQQVYQDMDVVLGGGGDYLLPDPKKSTDPKSKMRIDNENMQTVLEETGYNFVTTKAEMLAVKEGKLWGAFAPKAMSKDLVKSEAEPTLAEMTSKSLELLSKNNDGFFLMVEGSQVDWAAHPNQTIGLVSEIKAFDQAVGVALNYAKSNKDTLVIVATDHGNGGISIGDASTSGNYSELPPEYFTSVLKKATITEEAAGQLISAERTNVKEIMAKLGVTDLTDEEEKVIVEAKGVDKDGKAFNNTVTEMSKLINKRSHIGWTTGGHTGEDVPLFVYAPSYNNQLTGTIQNSDIALYTAKAMGMDLDIASKELFVPQSELGGKGYNASIDLTDATNPVLVVEKSGIEYRFPENKNYYLENGVQKSYNGINVYNSKQFYIPQVALDMISGVSNSTEVKTKVEKAVPADVKTKEYAVKSGDTLWNIANSQGVSLSSIIEVNNINNPDLIYVGQILLIK